MMNTKMPEKFFEILYIIRLEAHKKPIPDTESGHDSKSWMRFWLRVWWADVREHYPPLHNRRMTETGAFQACHEGFDRAGAAQDGALPM